MRYPTFLYFLCKSFGRCVGGLFSRSFPPQNPLFCYKYKRIDILTAVNEIGLDCGVVFLDVSLKSGLLFGGSILAAEYGEHKLILDGEEH